MCLPSQALAKALTLRIPAAPSGNPKPHNQLPIFIKTLYLCACQDTAEMKHDPSSWTWGKNQASTLCDIPARPIFLLPFVDQEVKTRRHKGTCFLRNHTTSNDEISQKRF